MNGETVQYSDPGGAYVRLPVPVGEPDAFSHQATADVLQLLVDNPDRTFTNRQLQRVTERGLGGVNAAVRQLEALGVVDVERDGRANDVRVAPDAVETPSDSVSSIPQPEFHEPVREIRSQVEDRIGRDAGIVLFGSVARGEADRASDVDCFVVVDRDRMGAQRTAHEIEQDVFENQIDGDRYEPHIVVETAESAVEHDRIRDVLVEGVTIRESAALDAVKRSVFDDGT